MLAALCLCFPCVCCVRALYVCVYSECGAVVLVEGQTAIHSPNYPQFYGNDCVLRWVVYAPRGHVVKVTHKTFQWAQIHDWRIPHTNLCPCCVAFQLDFADFSLEESDRCSYDSLTVLGDVEGRDEIGKMDGSPGFFPPLSPLIFVVLCSFCPPLCRLCLCCIIASWFKKRHLALGSLFCSVLCSRAVRWQRSSSCPVLPQRHGASVHVGQQHHTQRLQCHAIIHQPYRCVHGVWCLGLVVPWWSELDFFLGFHFLGEDKVEMQHNQDNTI